MSTAHARSADEADTSSLKRRKAAGGAVAVDDDITVNGSTRPADWPAATGDIDLALHDLPHASSDTEWWYVNLHVTAENGRQFSGFASFFRIIRDYVEEQKQYRHVHALTWGLIDPANKKYAVLPILDVNTPAILKRQLDNNEYGLDSMMMAAFKEMVDKGQVPLPDRTFTEEAKVPLDRLDLHYESNYFTKDASGAYHCHCEDKSQGIAYTLVFKATKPVTRHGHGGVVKIARKGEDMFYYFIPRMSVEGTVTIGGETLKVKGQGWYDHEFGGAVRCGPLAVSNQATTNGHANGSESKEAAPKKTIDYSWNWLAAQLDDGTDISATLVHNYTDKVDLDNFALVIRPDGRREEFNTGVALTSEKVWQSVRTAGKYPVRWRLTVPDAKIDLVCEAPFPEQECITILAKPAFWEGLVLINGTIDGKPVSGRGFIERHGFHDNDSLDKFFKTISKIVQGEICALLPTEPTWTQTRDLMARQDMDHLMDGVDLGVFSHTLIKPLREIVDRGGKSWRSYALLLCADAVGGESYSMQRWLSMPEIMHVGSLIVDDIQDKSLIRRGGPTVHSVYGEALAINCGTAAYFIGTNVLANEIDDQAKKLRIYELYFLTLRAGHAGQAFDIHGLDYLMDEAVASGNNDKLVRAVTCTHRLKSAVPAGNLARMGAILGGGSEPQIEHLGRYFESVGVAFQIIDDVLNLRGMATKDLGEDIKAGKITHPVCLAMDGKRLTLEQRKWMWDTIKSKPQDQAVVNKVIDLISSCGALDHSEKIAGDMVDAAWQELDPLLLPSTYKLRMRAFGFYVLRRHY